MNFLDEYKYKAIFEESWGYYIYDLNNNFICKSTFEFDSKGEAEYAAVGHISLLINKDKESLHDKTN